MGLTKFIELFSGIGGFRLGLEKSNRQQQKDTEVGRCGDSFGDKGEQPEQSEEWGNYTCVWANDNDKYACQIYRKRFGGQEIRGVRNRELSIGETDLRQARNKSHNTGRDGRGWGECSLHNNRYFHEPSGLYEGDIRAVDVDRIPNHDILCAGFPCQSFSIAGKRRGFEDTRGTLFFEICRVLRAKRPGYLLLENVKGLLSADNGEIFQTILMSLEELGYDVQWQVLNSKDFGVPQNRERVFIIGHLRELPRPKVFPIGETDQAYTNGNEQRDQEIMIYDVFNEGLRANQELAGALKGAGVSDTSLGTAIIAQALRAEHHNTADVHYLPGIRRLTPLECERLQGFPDGWTEGISDTQRYKCLGNAVTVNVIETIGRQLNANQRTD